MWRRFWTTLVKLPLAGHYGKVVAQCAVALHGLSSKVMYGRLTRLSHVDSSCCEPIGLQFSNNVEIFV